MKKILVTMIAALMVVVSASAAKAPKYVFLFIGDGMGTNTVNFTELYLQSLDGKYGYKHLGMTQLPVAGIATTYSANSDVTDSAASATAMASGVKTKNGSIGVDPEKKPVESIAEKAKRNGKKVAILTNVGVNHATPAGFYAHQRNRGMYDEILQDLVKADFDFYAGSGYCGYKKTATENIFPIDSDVERDNFVKNAGFAVVRSQKEYDAAFAGADKMVMLTNNTSRLSYDYSSDESKARHMILKNVTKDAINFLMKDGCKKGFFMMVEGGQIDGCNHGNDAAKAIREVIDFDEAIAVAYEFYLQHPKETAIVITADHDTGSPCVLSRNYEDYACFQYQDASQSDITSELKHMMKAQEEVVSWEQVKGLLDKHLKLWSKMNISKEKEAVIRAEYDATIAKRETGHVVDPYAYADDAQIAKVAVEIYDGMCGVKYVTTDHSAAYVPVYAVGPGTQIFSSLNDNTDMCKKLVKIANYK